MSAPIRAGTCHSKTVAFAWDLMAEHGGWKPPSRWPAYSRWPEDDLRAVWLHMHSLEPIVHEAPASTLTGAAATGTGASRGEAIFDVHCVICHGEKGTGSPFTTVALNEAAGGVDDQALRRFIAKGLPGTSMPGFGKTLTDEPMADLMAFIRAW